MNPPDTRKILENPTCVTGASSCSVGSSARSDLDPIPASLLKECIGILLTLMASKVNLSLSEGSFHSHFKSVLISPLLKRPPLNKDIVKNYRPVFNLGFLSKVLEKVVVSHLNSHLNSSNISNRYQSAYKKFHSTEIAILKIHKDILSSIDAGKIMALTLLDLCLTFDTVGHTITLRRVWWLVQGDWDGTWLVVCVWKMSVACECRFWLEGARVCSLATICLSSKADLTFRIRRRSVLHPLLCTAPLSSIISGRAIPYHLYAGDSQLYVLLHQAAAAALNGLLSCLASVQSWMTMKKFKLNPHKTILPWREQMTDGAKVSLYFLLTFLLQD